MQDVDYHNCLLALDQAIGVDRLELRRLRADLTLTYNIIFCLIDVDPNKCFNIYNGPPLPGHIYRLRCNTQRLNTTLHLL